MCDNYRGAARCNVCERLLNKLFSERIDIGRSLIKDQNRWICDNSPAHDMQPNVESYKGDPILHSLDTEDAISQIATDVAEAWADR